MFDPCAAWTYESCFPGATFGTGARLAESLEHEAPPDYPAAIGTLERVPLIPRDRAWHDQPADAPAEK